MAFSKCSAMHAQLGSFTAGHRCNPSFRIFWTHNRWTDAPKRLTCLLLPALTPSQQQWETRKRLVSEHVLRLEQRLNSPHPISISTFGSSLSGLCLADSDIDLGLFGSYNGILLENLRPGQQQALLKLVLKAIKAAKLSKGMVQAIWGARIPVLKYTCSLSGLDCDISLQGTGALVKANFINILNRSSKHLAPLYRLVKLWAQAHDLNDATRSTFNSTSLLYMTIFYLQQLQLLPALQDLVPPQLLGNPSARLLQGSNKGLWERPGRLQALLDAVQERAADWFGQVEEQQQQQRTVVPRLGELLRGFYQMWSGQLADWVLGRNRDLHADIWQGTWAPGSFQRPYIFSLQDPFDASDCPARAVGSSTNTNGGTAAFIAYMFSSSSRVMQRYSDLCRAAAADRGVVNMQHELCKLLAWLFGPQAVVLLDNSSCSSSSAGPAWALQPFPPNLVAAVRQRQRQQQKPGSLLLWLVEELGAALDQDRNVLCLNQLSLLTRQAVAGVGAGREPRHVGRAGNARAGAAVPDQSGGDLDSAAASAAAVAAPRSAAGRHRQTASKQQHHHLVGELQHDHHLPEQQQQRQHIQQQRTHLDQQPQQQQQQQQQQQWSSPVLEGPPLPHCDSHLVSLQQQLEEELTLLQHKQQQQPGRASPKRLPKAVRKAAQHAVQEVLLRLQKLEQQQQQQGVGSSSSSTGYGLIAVLHQHGFTPLLEHWGYIQDGVLWEQLLPPAFSSSSSGIAGRAPLETASVVVRASAMAVSAAVAGAVASTSSSSGNSMHSKSALLKLLGNAVPSQDPTTCLHGMYKHMRAFRLHLLEASGGQQAEALVAAASAANQYPRYSQTIKVVQQDSLDSEASVVEKRYAVVTLPELVVLQPAAGSSSELVLQQLVPAKQFEEEVRGPAQSMDKMARIAARAALVWLGQQPGVFEAVAAAAQHHQQMKQQRKAQRQERQQKNFQEEQQQQDNGAVQETQHQQQPMQQLVPQRGPTVRQGQHAPPPAGNAGQVEAAASSAVAAALSSLTSPKKTRQQQQQQQQQQQRQQQQLVRQQKEPPLCGLAGTSKLGPAGAGAAGPVGDEAARMSSLTLGTAGASEAAAPRNSSAAADVAAAEAAAMAAKRASRQLQNLKQQISSLMHRIEQKQQKLQQDEALVAELEQEERSALQAAGLVGSSSSSNSGVALGGIGADFASSSADSDGLLLLELAMQQSTDELLKGLRHDLSNAKGKVRSDQEALRQFAINLKRLQGDAAAAAAAVQKHAAAANASTSSS